MNKDELYTHIDKHYHITPDYPWAKFPDYAVFRHKHNNKWFCLLAYVSADKLGLAGDDKHPIINVKIRPEHLGLWLCLDGFLPAYHMNKEHWLSILLEIAHDDDVIHLLADSFELTTWFRIIN